MLDPKFWKPAKMAKTVALLGRVCVCVVVFGKGKQRMEKVVGKGVLFIGI